MEKRFEEIDGFVEQVRARLNRHLGLDILIRSVGGAGVILLLIGLCYILRGRHVPRLWYPVVSGLALVTGLVCWIVRRRSFDEAAAHADRHFQLKDTVCSYEGFARAEKQGGIYELQAEYTEAALEKLEPAQVKYRWPVRTAVVCVGLLSSSALLTLKADSPMITAADRQAEQMLAQTEQINEEIDEILEEIGKQAEAEDIEKLVVPEELKKLAEQLEETSDLKDALRQYAQLEKELNTALSKLQRRQDEQLYEKMGEALEESEQAKALGKQLKERQYKEAAEELKDLKIDEKAPAAEQQRQLEKIKAVAQRMAQEAERSRSACKAAELAKQLSKAANSAGQAMKSSDKGAGTPGATGSPRGKQDSNTQGSSSQSSGSQGNSSSGSGSEGSGSLGTAADGTGSGGGDSGGVNEALDQMAGDLSDLDAKCKAESLIQSLCKSLSQCQGKLCDGSGGGNGSGSGQGGDGDQPGDGSGDGGLEPGTGSSSNTNANINNARSTGDKSALKGIKGQGPSVKTTETASDGSGSSSGVTTRRIRQYRRQAESFIRREDVPEAVKSGVKEYFESIHHTEEGN